MPSVNPRAALYLDCDFVGRNGIIETPFSFWVELILCYNVRAAIAFAKFNKNVHFHIIQSVVPLCLSTIICNILVIIALANVLSHNAS